MSILRFDLSLFICPGYWMGEGGKENGWYDRGHLGRDDGESDDDVRGCKMEMLGLGGCVLKVLEAVYWNSWGKAEV